MEQSEALHWVSRLCARTISSTSLVTRLRSLHHERNTALVAAGLLYILIVEESERALPNAQTCAKLVQSDHALGQAVDRGLWLCGIDTGLRQVLQCCACCSSRTFLCRRALRLKAPHQYPPCRRGLATKGCFFWCRSPHLCERRPHVHLTLGVQVLPWSSGRADSVRTVLTVLTGCDACCVLGVCPAAC